MKPFFVRLQPFETLLENILKALPKEISAKRQVLFVVAGVKILLFPYPFIYLIL